MNKTIIGILVATIVSVIAIYIVLPNNDQESTSITEITQVASAIIVSEPPYDFGDIDIFGGKVQTTYTLKNTGSENVNILSAVTSCMCTEGEIGGLRFGMHESSSKTVIIPAGGEKILTAIYDPLAHGPDGVGKVKRDLFLKTNSIETPEIRLQFTANVVKN